MTDRKIKKFDQLWSQKLEIYPIEKMTSEENPPGTGRISVEYRAR